MAVDAPGVRRDLFNLVRMFGPANAGGPAQSNTNPGASPAPPAELPPPPDPAAQVMNQTPQPQGVRVLPQTTPIAPNVDGLVGARGVEPNPGVVGKATQPKLVQGGSPQDGAIELLPGDADPNLLPPELRDSWMFRYQQAQRAAAYKAAEEQARWQNFVGGIGNIAQIATGGRPTNQTGARPEAPGAADVGTLYGWKKDYDATRLAAENKAELTRQVYALAKERGWTQAQADALIAGTDASKLREAGFRIVDPKEQGEARFGQMTADRKDYEAMLDEAKQRGVKPRFESFEDYKAFTEGTRSPNQQYQATGAIIKDFGERRQKLADSRSTIRNSEAMQQALDAGTYGDGTVFGNFKTAAAREVSGLLGFTPEKIANQQAYESALTQEAGRLAKQWGPAPTDADAQRALQVAGGTLSATSPEAIQAIIRLRAKSTIAEINEHNLDVEHMAARSRNPDTAEGMRWTRYDVQPEERDRLLRVSGIPQASLDRLRTNPTPEERRLFDGHYGPYSEFVLGGGSR